MFFQSKRKGLWKRLWRLRVKEQQHATSTSNNKQTESVTGGEGSSFAMCCTNSTSTNSINQYDRDEYELFLNLVNPLKDQQLETLHQAIQSERNVGASTVGTTGCVLVQRGQKDLMDMEPHVIACRIWKYPDLQYAEELKAIPSCINQKDRIYACCNPTHWSRLCRPETPPPPYCQFAMDRLRPEDRAPCEERLGGYRDFPGSLTTDGEDSLPNAWCQLAYWELAQRVGRLWPVENSSVNIFSEQPLVNGVCLSSLASQRRTPTPDNVQKVRQKIGLGITISRESDGVWLYNRSSALIFVHSPTLHEIEFRTLLVYRVPPGHCLRVFDPNRAHQERFAFSNVISAGQTGPVDTHSVRISFAKGWGPNYSRQEVTGCPCWLEVLLNPVR